MNREKSLIKNTIIISFGTFIPKLTSIVTLPIITAGLTLKEFGTYDLINTLVSLFLPILTLQIQTAAFRFLIEKRNMKAEITSIVSTILLFILITSMCSIFLLFLLLHSISYKIRILICLYFFFDMIMQSLAQIMRGIEKNKIFSINSIIQSFLNMLLILITVKALHLGLFGVMIASTISCMLSTIYMFHYGNIKNYYSIHFFSRKLLIEMLKYSWPMIPNGLSLWVMNISDRLIVSAFLGLEANAIYAVANKIPSLFAIVQSTFTYAWQENASESANDTDATLYYTNIFDTIFNILVGCMSILIACTPILFSLLIKGNYYKSYNQMPILFMGIFFSTVSSFIGGIYIAKKQTRSVGITTTFAALLNFLINISLVRYIGIYAASLSTVISYMFLAFYRMKDIQKFQIIRFNRKRIFCGISILFLMCLVCSIQAKEFNIINGLCSFAVVNVYNYNLLKKIIYNIRRK